LLSTKQWLGVAALLSGISYAVWLEFQTESSVAAESRWSAIPYTDKEAVAKGRELYMRSCAACHGADLKGQPNWRKRDSAGYLPAPPHDESGHTWHHEDQQLFVMVKEGVKAVVGDDYRTNMRAFGDQLSDDQIWSILAYIKSTWPQKIIAAHNRFTQEP